MATRMSSFPGPSGYVLVPLRVGVDFTLYRGRWHGNPSPVLAITLSAEQPSPWSVRRLGHEYSLAAELNPAWAAKPQAFTRHEGRTILLLKDPGGEPLDLSLERDKGQPLDLTRFLRIAVGLATALGQVHQHGLIHKDIKRVQDAERKAMFLSHRTLIAKTPEEFKYDVSILEYQGWNRRCVDRVSACWSLQGSFSPRLLI